MRISFPLRLILWFNALTRKKVNSRLSPEAFRQNGKQRMAVASRWLDYPKVALASVEDRRIGIDGREIPVRIYHPAPQQDLPVLVYFHGGGFVLGSLESHDALCRRIARDAACVLVAVDYRLAPEHPFPAAVEDALAATRWVAAHASEIGGIADTLVVGGDSAGGNLAAVVALMARDQGGPFLKGQVLIYPVTDGSMTQPSYQENARGYVLESHTMEWFFAHYCQVKEERRDPRISVLLREDLQGLPPALVLTAGLDPLRDEGNAFAAKLRDAGNAVEHREFPNMIHTFIAYQRRLPEAREAMRLLVDFLKKTWS